jgi:membrane-bound serine protease (ClpP class)
MIGEEGVVTVALAPNGEGMIRVHGELWRAVSKAGATEGTKVRVLRVDGLRLEVEPVTTAVPSGS